MRWFKRHVLELILLAMLAAVVVLQYLIYFDARARQHTVKTTAGKLSELDSLRLNNAWLSYNDSLMRNPRKVVAAKSLKILEKERRISREMV